MRGRDGRVFRGMADERDLGHSRRNSWFNCLIIILAKKVLMDI